MSVELRPCGLQGWAVCEGNCGNCGTTATTTTDGYWYHGNGKLGGEFHPTKPDDEERYGEYIKIVRCKDCKWYTPFRNIQSGEMDEGECEGYDPCVPANHFCSRGERKESK